MYTIPFSSTVNCSQAANFTPLPPSNSPPLPHSFSPSSQSLSPSATFISWSILLLLFFFSVESMGGQYPELVREKIREKVEIAHSIGGTLQAEDLLIARNLLPRFYQQRAYKTIWVQEEGISAEALEVMAIIGRAATEGLNANDYHFQRLQAIIAQLQGQQSANKPLDINKLASMELLLTDAYLLYGSHLFYGKVNPETTKTEWKAQRKNPEIALEVYLQKAYQDNSLSQSLEKLSPQQVEYQKLKRALRHYRQIMEAHGEFSSIAGGTSIKKGERDARIPAIRKRLTQTRDLASTPSSSSSSSSSSRESSMAPARGAASADPSSKTAGADPSSKGVYVDQELYDESLEKVVKRFQARHGLNPDGVIGQGTLGALNMSLEERINKIELNLERWRWLPENLGSEYIMVNIPNFRMNLIENDSSVLELSAVVGKYQRKTPVFSGRMTYLVLNPTWTVPPTILANDILPEVRKNIDYLARKNIRVLNSGGKEIDPSTLDWQQLKASNFPYILRQDPGPGNALGIVKFMFPNQYNVYIHDTPSKEFFAREDRAFSSGCIRLQNPMSLTYHLLKDSPRHSRESIDKLLSSNKEQTIMLPKPMNVHILYLTSWADQEGSLVNFRKDVYNRDAAILKALKNTAPLI